MLTVFRLLAVREVTSHGTRSALTAVGVAIGAAVVVAVLALNHSVLGGFQGMVNTLAGGADLQVRGGLGGVPQSLLDSVAQDPDVESAGGYLEAWLFDPATQQRVLCVGLDLLAAEPAPGLMDSGALSQDSMQQLVEDPLRFLNSTHGVILNSEYAERLALKRGGTRSYVFPTGPQQLIVEGILPESAATRALGGAVALMGLDAAQVLLGKQDKLDVVNIRLKAGASVSAVRRRVAQLVGTGLTVEAPEQRGKRLARMMLVLTTVMRLISLVAVMVGIFIVQNTLATAVLQRRREIAIQRALGMGRAAIAWMVMAEACVLALVGAALGIPLGLGLARAAMGLVQQSVATLYAEIPPTVPAVSTQALGWVVLGSVVFSCLAALRPAQNATRVPPAMVLGSRGAGAPETPMRRPYAMLGLAFLCVAGAYGASLLPQVGTDPWWGYVACLLVLGAGAAASPSTLLGVHALAVRVTRHLSVPVRLGTDGLTRDGSRSARTASALMLGLALFIGISSVVDSFKSTLFAWVEQAVPADLSVMEGSALPGARAVPMLPTLGEGLAADPDVERVVFQRFRSVDLGEQVTKIQALDATGYLLRARLPVLEQVGPVDGAALEAGEVLLSEGLARLLKLHAGDVLRLPTAHGEKTMKIRAVVMDYSSEIGAVFMDWKVYAALYDDAMVDSFMLYLKPGADVEKVGARILAQQGKDRGLQVVTHQAFKGFVEEVVDNAFAATRALQLVAVLIALMGIINTLLAAVLDRLREIGVLRAVGATRAQVVGMMTSEALLLGLTSALLASVVGSAFGFVFTTVVADAATGWTLPFHVPFKAVGESFLLALLVSAVAAAIPAQRAAKTDVLTAMRVG